MVNPTTATAGAETSMVRLMEGPETSTDRLEVKGSHGTNMAMVSLASLVSMRLEVEVPTTAIRTRLEEVEDTRGLREGRPGPVRMEVEDMARGLREGGPGPERMELEVEGGPRPTPGVAEELEPPEPAGPPPHSPPS